MKGIFEDMRKAHKKSGARDEGIVGSRRPTTVFFKKNSFEQFYVARGPVDAPARLIGRESVSSRYDIRQN